MDNLKNNIAYKYAYSVANGLEPQGTTGKYIIKQCKDWIDIADGKHPDAVIDLDELELLEDMLQIMMFPDNPTQSISENLTRYGWLFIVATLCTKCRDDLDVRYYETSILEIARKNFKTFNSAIIFVYLMLTEKNFSRFFSVAPTYKLSCELMLTVKKIIKVSPALRKRFKVLTEYAECSITDNSYTPLAYSGDSLDGKLATVFLCDETGLLDDYPLEAMRSSQITLDNKLGIIISTQYPNVYNTFLTEVDFAKKILDKLEDGRVFALLYEPDEEIRDNWKTDDNVIYQSNPVAVDIPKIFDNIVKKRKMAILYASKRENYFNKHNNIHYIGGSKEGYVDTDILSRCILEADIDWTGRDVWLGIDLAETDDNTAISMIAYDEDEDTIYCKSWAIIPTDKVDIKMKQEKVNYNKEIEMENCFDCGDDIIDYEFIYDFICKIEEKWGVNIIQLGYDLRNARATAQRLEVDYGMETVDVAQHSRILHSPIKKLKEYMIRGKFKYYNNKLLDTNFLNCRQTEDTNKNKYLNKKKSVGKIDMVMSIVDAMYLLEQELLDDSWIVQR